MPPKRNKRGAKRMNPTNETPQKKHKSNLTKDVQSKIMLPSQSNAHIVYASKAIYGLIVSVFPMVAAYLHPEVTQPQEPERGELPPPVAGSLRLAANQQSLSDRQAEVTATVTSHRRELQKCRDQHRDMRSVLFTSKHMDPQLRTGFIASYPNYQELAGNELCTNLAQFYDSKQILSDASRREGY